MNEAVWLGLKRENWPNWPLNDFFKNDHTVWKSETHGWDYLNFYAVFFLPDQSIFFVKNIRNLNDIDWIKHLKNCFMF